MKAPPKEVRLEAAALYVLPAEQDVLLQGWLLDSACPILHCSSVSHDVAEMIEHVQHLGATALTGNSKPWLLWFGATPSSRTTKIMK
jgi:hypothetical protein